MQLTPEDDRDRVVLIDASMAGGRLELEPSRTASLAALRRARFCRSIPKAFIYPVRSLWTNRKLIASMVRRDILARSRGSFGGALWTFLNPLLLMATYFFVFGVVLQQVRRGFQPHRLTCLYFLAGMLPWLPFSEAVGRSPYVVIEHRNFVKKLVFPLETLPVNLVLAGLVTEVFALAIFFASLLAIRAVGSGQHRMAAGATGPAIVAGRGAVLVSLRAGRVRARPGPDHRLPADRVVFHDADLLPGVAGCAEARRRAFWRGIRF